MPSMEIEHVETEIQENAPRKTRGSALDHFSYISSEKEAVRLKHGWFLLTHLFKNNENSEVNYALNRLIRGLGASRNSSRMGFYSTLVALLSTFPSLRVEQILECVKKQLQTGSSNSKSEVGDIHTGQILTCGAIIRSGMFFNASSDEQKNILEMLLSAGTKRSYLGMAMSSFVAELLALVDENQFKTLIWPTLKSKILKPLSEQPLDNVYLLFMVQNKFPEVLTSGILKKNIGTRELLSSDNMLPLSEIMMDIPRISSLKHPAYALISQEVATSPFVSTFVTHLDQQLATKLNRNKLLAVSIILRNILSNIQDPSQIPQLLTTNFIKQMLQYFRNHYRNNHDQEFQETMAKFFDALSNSLQSDNVDDKIKISVLKTLLFYPGSFMIENITKSKILQQIVRMLNEDGVKKLSKLFKDVITAKKEKTMDDNVTELWLNSERIYAAQLLTKLLSHPSVQNELEWKVENLKLLLNFGIVRHEKYSNVGAELAGGLREIFFRALDHKFSKLENISSVLLELTNYLQTLVTSENYEDILRVSLNEEEFAILEQMYATTKNLESKIAKNKSSLVFQILFLHMGLQLFKDKELAIASLKELFLCYEKVKHDKKPKSNDEANDPEWIEVVVDLFLNLLSHNSHLLRNIINCVFPHLCKHMTPSSIHQILSVLDPKNEVNPLSKGNESDSEESDENGEEEEEGNDDDENESEDNEESEESDAEFEENETVNDKLRMAVQKALGNDGYQTDEESINLEDMSDTEGERLDKALAQAFKQFKPNRGKNNKKQTKDAQILTHFRVRVLDLIEIYLDSEPAMLSCLEIMLPLLQTFEFTIKDEHQQPLQHRIKHCMKKLTNLKKFSSTDGITEVILGDLLSSLLEKGTKSAMIIQDMSTELSDCCIFVIKCSQILCANESFPKKMKKKLKEKLLEILENAVNLYFNQRDCLIPYYLFKSMFQLTWDGNLKLVPLVFGFVCNDEMRPFRKSQGLELLKLFYLNRRLQGMEESFRLNLSKHERQFCKYIVNMLGDFCNNPKTKTIKERIIYHLFNLLKAMASHPIKNEEIDWNLIGEKIREYRSFVALSKDAKIAFNQLCSQLKVSNIVKMKNQTIKLSDDKDDESEDLNKEKEGKRKRKGKGSLESKKLKKEARTLRFQSLSEGLPGHISFSNVNVTKVRNEDDEENTSKRLKKQKQKTVSNEDSEDESEEPRFNSNEDTDKSITKSHKKKNKRLSNGTLESEVDVDVEQASIDKIKSKKSKKRLSSESQMQNNGISLHKKKRRN